MRSLITEERFGTAGFGQFTYQRNRDGHQARLNKYPLTMLHPMMLEQSIHHLDLIRFVYGREVEAVACRTWNPVWSMYAHDANVACLLTLEGGLEVSYLGTWTGGWNELQFEWRTDCSKGVIIQRELFDTLATANTDDTTLNLVALPEARPFFDDTRSLLQAFIGAVRRGGPPPCTGRDHLRSLALCFAAIEASETGRRVMTSDFHARHNLEDFV
jgi:predicted dehydrogenase